MELVEKKCSSEEHKETNAIKYCQECKLYLCRNCDKFHSNLFKKHHTFSLDEDIKEIFTGFCKIENHQSELIYFCKDHNELVCAKCITKIKGQGNGQHTDCDICYIREIGEEKKEKLKDNIINLEKLSELYQASIEDLKKIFEEIDKNKEDVMAEIHKVFTTIRTKLNDREDELLKQIDKIYEKKIFSQNIEIFKDKKYGNKIKTYIEKGKLAEKDWEINENKNSLINDCINVEKTIKKINKLNAGIEKYRSKNKKLKFFIEPDELINLIKKQGSFNDYNLNQQEININIEDYIPHKLSLKKQINNNYYCNNSNIYDNLCFFISKNDEYVLGYVNSNDCASIIFYDINNNNELKTIKNANGGNAVSLIKYYNYSKYDMILSCCQSSGSNITIWNFNESKNIVTISNAFYYSGYYYYAISSCVILEKNNFNIFSVTPSFNCQITMHNSGGGCNKNVGKNDTCKYYIDSFDINEKKYIISGGNQGIEVYNHQDFNLYHLFREGSDSNSHYCGKIIETNKGYNLIDVGSFNFIRIWDFVNKNLVTKINSDTNNQLYGFVVINNNYIIIGSQDKNIKEFDIENPKNIKNISQHTSNVIGLKPIKDKNENIFLVSYGLDKNLFLWEFK